VIPRVSTYLDQLARALGEQVAPRLPTAYEQAGLLREPMHLQAVRVEFERAASRRVQENQAIRGLLSQGAALADAPQAQAWREAGAGRDSDLRVSALQSANDALRASLIELHAWLETLPEDGPVRALLDAVWQELRESTERRALPSDRF
jgi:hypothetical protein